MLLKALVIWELVSKLCSTLCDPMGCSPPGSSVHGIFQARVLEWVAISSSGDLPNPGIKPRSPALQAVSLPTEPPGKAIIKGIRCSELGELWGTAMLPSADWHTLEPHVAWSAAARVGCLLSLPLCSLHAWVWASAHTRSRMEMSGKACAVCSSPPCCPVSKCCGNAGPGRPAAWGGFSGTSQRVLSNQFSVRRARGALEGTAQAPISSTQVPEADRDPTQGLRESPGFVQKDFAPDSVQIGRAHV